MHTCIRGLKAIIKTKPNYNMFAFDLLDEWNQLSDEIILNVFKWLPKQVLARCTRVCKRWNRLA